MTLMTVIQMVAIDSEKLRICIYELEVLLMPKILALYAQMENLLIQRKMHENKDVEMVLSILMKDEMMAILVIQTDVLTLALLKLDIFEQEEMQLVLTLVLNVQMDYLLMMVLLSEYQFVEMEKNMKVRNEMMGIWIQTMVVVIYVS